MADAMAALLLLPLAEAATCSGSPKAAPLKLSLQRCPDAAGLARLHAHLIKTGLIIDTLLAARLLSAVCSATPSCSTSLTYAVQMFDGILHTDTVMWNAMIRAHSYTQSPEEALLVYCKMLQCRTPFNPYTFPFLLKACVGLSPGGLEETRQIHCHALKTGFASDVYTANALLHAYANSGRTDDARHLFDTMPYRDVVSWNSMVDGCVKAGEVDRARELFDIMPTKNVISWTTMITGCVEGGLFQEALGLFHEMQLAGVKPDVMVLTGTLSACAHLGALDEGRWIHAYIEKEKIRVDPALGCVLVDMYGKCGRVEEAMDLFKKMATTSDVSVWTAMINGLAVHGRATEALGLFVDMNKAGIRPNHMTLTGVLTACSHAGFVEEGKALFERMERDYGISPSVEHYGCMVNLLGRAGLLEEARDMIKMMPLKANAAVWGALLSACHMHRNSEMGKEVGNILVELDSRHCGRYVSLAGILAAEGRWDDAVTIRGFMRGRGVRKLPGCSSICVDGEVHEFFAGDCSHTAD